MRRRRRRRRGGCVRRRSIVSTGTLLVFLVSRQNYHETQSPDKRFSSPTTPSSASPPSPPATPCNRCQSPVHCVKFSWVSFGFLSPLFLGFLLDFSQPTVKFSLDFSQT